jgi:hypothetical protein
MFTGCRTRNPSSLGFRCGFAIGLIALSLAVTWSISDLLPQPSKAAQTQNFDWRETNAYTLGEQT